MIPVIEEQDGINGKWQVARPDPPRELKFDPNAVRENLKRGLKSRTTKVRQHKLP